MDFTWIEEQENLPDTILFPLSAEEGLKDQLELLAGHYGLPAEKLERDFEASKNQIRTLYNAEGKTLILVGLGKMPGFKAILTAFRSVSHKRRQQLDATLGIDLSFVTKSIDPEMLAEAACNGLVLGTYFIGRFKDQKDFKPHPLEGEDAKLVFYSGGSGNPDFSHAAAKGFSLAASQKSIFDLVNAPGNKKTPTDLANWALASGKEHGYKVRVMDRKAIEEAGLHALLAVNRGSEYEPAFIIMEYEPREMPDKQLRTVGLVGKGVTFDTGGLSIKPAQNMHLMKSDMGGAAAVFGTMEAAARLQLPVKLVGIVPATDNCVDAKSVKPGDIIDSYNGKTIEIIDTDAEGRLILADGLSYICKQFSPDVLIDLATLTGSAVRALGYHAAALFSGNEKLLGQLQEAGKRTGERCWPLPMWDEYGEELKADMADLRNLGKRPIAGAIFAAKFLESFTDGHGAWAHLDIAGVAFQQSAFAGEHSATGYGVRLLVDFLENMPDEAI